MKACRFLAFLALILLTGCGTQYYGGSGLCNALYQSDLHLNGVNIKSGQASVDPGGTLPSGGKCETSRIEAQINETAVRSP
jgi:hypothetical protein